MACYLNSDAAGALYGELSQYARGWLQASGWTTATAFQLFCAAQPVHFLRVGSAGILLVTNWFHYVRAEIHPLLRDKRFYHDQDRIRAEARRCMDELEVGRLEFRVRRRAGVALRRALQTLGATREAILRRADIEYRTGVPSLIDIELWAILDSDLGMEAHYGTAEL